MFRTQYKFGNNVVYYAESRVSGHEGKTVIGFAVYPESQQVEISRLHLDSLIQVAFSDDESLFDYTSGVTMTCRSSTLLKVVRQSADEYGVTTELSDGLGNCYTHCLHYSSETGVFSTCVEYRNETGHPRMLEKLSSFALSGITALSENKSASEELVLYRLTSAWSRECRLKRDAFSALGVEPSWAQYGVKCERWGQIGSMPNRGWYPFAAVEDTGSGTVWGVQIEAPYSWQLELCGEKESITLSGGLADYEFGHWRKEIPAGGSFRTHEAFFTVLSGTLNDACNALVHEADSHLHVPVAEEDMPVLFNEYCTTWGCPSAENIRKILTAIKDFPIGTFVIDAGWYKPDDKGWCNAIGDWNESVALFPSGIREVVREIREAGMRAGIWFEFEVAGRDSACFQRGDLLLKRDGSLITCKNRRFLDLRKDTVKEYLREKFLRFLKENGFEYLKIDYNDAYGIGCDGAESLGEGGRQVAEESIGWLDLLKKELPDLVIENCASGGSRIESLRMSQVSMCSFSDAHECAEIPLVAANLSRVIPARQMQIWAVLREGESDVRTVYSLCAAMLGRICLSGDVLSLSTAKRTLINEGLEFYRDTKEIVRYGDIVNIDCSVRSYRDPKGCQIYEKKWGSRSLIIIHNLNGEQVIDYPVNGKLVRHFTSEKYEYEYGVLRITMNCMSAGAFLFES